MKKSNGRGLALIESRLAIADTVGVMSQVLKLRAAKEFHFAQCHVAGGADKRLPYISLRAGGGLLRVAGPRQ